MSHDHYQNLLIGSGEASKYLAWTLAKEGERTALVERALIGGSCPNIACLPSKNVIHSAKVASLLKRGAEFGVGAGETEVDMAAVYARKRKMVDELIALHLQKYQESGAELIMGEARFTALKSVEVKLVAGGTRTLTADRVFINVGTRSALPQIPGLAAAAPMSHVEALNLQRVPQHLVVMGGGYIGLEFAQAFRRFGSAVTIIHRAEHLLDHEDTDISLALRELMEREGITVLTQAEVTKVDGISGERVRLEFQQNGRPSVLEATDLLLAVGRTPNTAMLGLEEAGVRLDAHGYIEVNERLETSVADTWALGDCAGSPKFTHAAYDDFRVVHANLTGGNRSTRDRLIPYCLFTDPEVARVGLSEREAQTKGIPYRLARLPMKAILRTWTISEQHGFFKALVGADDRILGFAAFGAEASELLAAVQTAMIGQMPYQSLRDAIFTHPTVAEGLVMLFKTPPPPVA